MKKKKDTMNSVKEFENTFNYLRTKYGGYLVWEDFLTASAVSIANALDFRQEREDLWYKITKRYNEEDISKLAKLLTMMVIELEREPKQDFLGQMASRLGLNDKHLGQCFTPYHIADLMAKCSIDEKFDRPFQIISDPTCGYGVMLIAARNNMLDAGKNIHQDLFCVAQDISFIAAMGCYIQMSLLGIAGYVRVGNTLTDPGNGNALIADEQAWCTPMYYLPEWEMRRILLRTLQNYYIRDKQKGLTKSREGCDIRLNNDLLKRAGFYQSSTD